MPGDLTAVPAAVICAAFVATAQPALIPLLRRAVRSRSAGEHSVNGGELALLGRTPVHLQPSQVAHRARLRAQRAALSRWPRLGQRLLASTRPAAAAGWPAGFTPLDAIAPQRWPDLSELAAGRVALLGVSRDLGEPARWDHADAPQLWRYHLHHWDWAWGLAAFLREVTAHAGFLRRHLESDVGGNHLIKDLKALAGLGVFLHDQRLLERSLNRLNAQLAVQVLPDGGHYERAPAYHCQVLADLIDVAGLVTAAGRAPGPELTLAITRMRRWLGAVLAPDGTVPLLNDGTPAGTPEPGGQCEECRSARQGRAGRGA